MCSFYFYGLGIPVSGLRSQLVDKDLEIAALREELAQQQLELQNSQQLRPEISQLRERILHYDKTFVQLKQLLLKVSSEKNAMEEENQALIEYRRKAEEKIAELEAGFFVYSTESVAVSCEGASLLWKSKQLPRSSLGAHCTRCWHDARRSLQRSNSA